MNPFAEKHPQGYLPKIQYWATALAEAAYLGEADRIPYIKSKLDYFTGRQMEITKKDIPGFEGTSSMLNNLTIYK
jgi:hypothetical protein